MKNNHKIFSTLLISLLLILIILPITVNAALKIGATVVDLTPLEANIRGYTGTGGVIIRNITPGSPAEKANLRIGDIIASTNMDILTGAITSGKTVLVTVFRDGKDYETSFSGVETPDAPKKSAPPTLLPRIEMPNLEIDGIANLTKVTKASCTGAGESERCGYPWIGEYISGLYKYSIGIIGMLAAVVIMYGGILWIVAGGNQSTVGEAKKWIEGALVGLFLAFGSYLILYTVNPSLTVFNPISVKMINVTKMDDLPKFPEENITNGSMPDSATVVASTKVVGNPGGKQLSAVMTASVQEAGQQMATEGFGGVIITDGLRSVEGQLKAMKDNCPAKATRSSDCTPPTCLIITGASDCPHTTGRAIDLWGSNKDGSQCAAGSDCQNRLTAIMRSKGFCKLDSEAWHFEKPQMSKACH